MSVIEMASDFFLDGFQYYRCREYVLRFIYAFEVDERTGGVFAGGEIIADAEFPVVINVVEF